MQRIGSSKFKLWSCVNLHGQGNAVLSIFGSEQNLFWGGGGGQGVLTYKQFYACRVKTVKSTCGYSLISRLTDFSG